MLLSTHLKSHPLRQTVPRDDLYPSFESNALRPKKTLCPETGVATVTITSSANQLSLQALLRLYISQEEPRIIVSAIFKDYFKWYQV